MPLRIAVPVVRATAAVLLACGAAGCMRSDVTRVARYQPGAAPLHKAAPEDSTYTVRYATVGQRKMRTVRGSARSVERGQPLGFRTAEDGTLLAVAGDEEFPLDAPADQVRKCVWYTRRKEPRQFVKEVGRFAQGTAQAAGQLAGKALEAGVNAALHIDDEDDEDCDDDDAGPWIWGGGGGRNHHSHHHHHGGGGNHGGSGGGSSKPKPGKSGGAKPPRVGARNP